MTSLENVDDVDPLAEINAELREKDLEEEDQPWLPLESNPVSIHLSFACLIQVFELFDSVEYSAMSEITPLPKGIFLPFNAWCLNVFFKSALNTVLFLLSPRKFLRTSHKSPVACQKIGDGWIFWDWIENC